MDVKSALIKIPSNRLRQKQDRKKHQNQQTKVKMGIVPDSFPSRDLHDDSKKSCSSEHSNPQGSKNILTGT